MAIYVLGYVFDKGVSSVPYLWPIIKVLPWLFLLWLLKNYFSGASNKSERKMNGKVILVTV